MLYKESELTRRIIGVALQVHREIGPGFQERIYHQSMIYALEEAGLLFESEKEFDIIFRNKLAGTFRADLVVEDRVIVELKSVCGEMLKLFSTQTISYLKASKLEVGLLINFGNVGLDIKRLAHYHDYNRTNLPV